MKQIILPRSGKSDVFKIQDVEPIDNLIKPEEVEVQVKYSGINFADLMMRQGLYKDAPKFPFVPGYEVSGVVARVGRRVTKFKEGDEVMAGTLFGGYASRIITHETLVYQKPKYLTMEQAAALPVNWVTAYTALVDMARVRPNDRVLIDAASGGVGTIALQILKALGVKNVIGLTTSVSKKAYIESFGGKAMTHEEFSSGYRSIETEEKFDVILNSQGGKSVKEHYDLLSPCGRVVVYGISSAIMPQGKNFGKLISLFFGMPKFNLIKMFDQNKGVFAINALKLFENVSYLKALGEKWKSIEEWKLTPHVDKVYSYQEVSQAHDDLANKKIKGKVILKWD